MQALRPALAHSVQKIRALCAKNTLFFQITFGVLRFGQNQG